jgi:hypothetical protein
MARPTSYKRKPLIVRWGKPVPAGPSHQAHFDAMCQHLADSILKIVREQSAQKSS